MTDETVFLCLKRRSKCRNAWFWRFKQLFEHRNASGCGVLDIDGSRYTKSAFGANPGFEYLAAACLREGLSETIYPACARRGRGPGGGVGCVAGWTVAGRLCVTSRHWDGVGVE